MKTQRFCVPLYDQTVIVCVGEPDAVAAWILRTFDIGEDNDLAYLALADGAAMGYPLKKDKVACRIVIYINASEMCKWKYSEQRMINTVTHEVYHACAKMLEAAEVAYDTENHEAHAYLFGWMCSKVLPVAYGSWRALSTKRVAHKRKAKK